MYFHIFNSRDRAYKNKYGAVKAGEPFSLRLLLPLEYGGYDVSAARLIIMQDGGKNLQTLNFTKTAEQHSGSAFWQLDLSVPTVGLYWYTFEFDAGYVTHHIYRGEYGTGYVDAEEDSWQLTVYDGEQVVDGAWRGGIMYQIFPDRFRNSGESKMTPVDREIVPWTASPKWEPDPETGAWNKDYFGGDLKGIERELPYLFELGVTYLYLNPIFEAHSNHRYDTADYMKIDPTLGKEEDFISLCMAAHNLGMKVILDGVFSHTGIDSIYFNRYRRYDSVGAFNSMESPYYSWYKFTDWPSGYKSWWGIDLLPEVEELDPSYLEFITGPGGVIEKWLRLGADGWRLDVADELPDEFIVAVKKRIKEVKPSALLLGEVWEDASNKTAYCKRREYLLGHELDSVMNYPFRNAIIDFVANDNAEDFFEQILTITENYPKEIVDSLMNPLGTHDTVRILTRLSGFDCEGMSREEQSNLLVLDRDHAKKLLKIAAVLSYTLPGFPCIYYGDEVGMEGGKDPFNRNPFPWGKEDKELQKFYKDLGRVRKNASILKDGDFVPISAADGCIAFERGTLDCGIFVIANRGPNTINYTLPEGITNPTTLLRSEGVEFGDGFVTLPGESFVIFENVRVILGSHRPGSQI